MSQMRIMELMIPEVSRCWTSDEVKPGAESSLTDAQQTAAGTLCCFSRPVSADAKPNEPPGRSRSRRMALDNTCKHTMTKKDENRQNHPLFCLHVYS